MGPARSIWVAISTNGFKLVQISLTGTLLFHNCQYWSKWVQIGPNLSLMVQICTDLVKLAQIAIVMLENIGHNSLHSLIIASYGL